MNSNTTSDGIHLTRVNTTTNKTNSYDSCGSNSARSNNHHNDFLRAIEVDQVGFSSLPEQVHRKSLKKGFEFTLLVVGDSGLGKSTLVNSLFMTDLYADRVVDNATDRITKTVTITSRTAELEEKGVRLKLTVVDTPGFGDSINLNESWKPIEEYIDKQFNLYYQHESGYGIDRKKLQDTRVHCCLYFIPPYVRGLRPVDIQTMRSMQSKVNIVPIIAKADSLTKRELEMLKQNIMADIEKYNIKIYEFPLCDSDDDESFKKIDEEIKNAIPFGIIGSNTVIESGGKRIRGRVYPWGIIDIESDTSCDFNKLRTFLCSSHMHDLKDLTHDVHYENYRTEYIKSTQKSSSNQKSTNGSTTPASNGNAKMSNEETDKLLMQKDLELKKMQELLAKMKMNMNGTNVRANGQHTNGSTAISYTANGYTTSHNGHHGTNGSLSSFGHHHNNTNGNKVTPNATSQSYTTQNSSNSSSNGTYHHHHSNFIKMLASNHPPLTNSTPI